MKRKSTAFGRFTRATFSFRKFRLWLCGRCKLRCSWASFSFWGRLPCSLHRQWLGRRFRRSSLPRWNRRSSLRRFNIYSSLRRIKTISTFKLNYFLFFLFFRGGGIQDSSNLSSHNHVPLIFSFCQVLYFLYWTLMKMILLRCQNIF